MRRSQFVMVLIVLAAFAFFTVRTVMPAHFKPCDFAVYYGASRAWLFGEDPYDAQQAPKVWQAAGGQADIMPDELDGKYGLPWLPIIQLPSSFPVLAPLAVLPAAPAIVIWYAICLVLLIAQTGALARLAGSELWKAPGMVLLALTLFLAPLHDAFGYGQPSGPAISLVVLAVYAASHRRDALAGALLAIAAAVKPQLVVVFFAFYLLSGRWRLVASLSIVFAAAMFISVVPMELRGIHWMSGWWINLREASMADGLNDTAVGSASRFYLLNLQVLIHTLVTAPWMVQLIPLAMASAIGGIFVWRRAQRDDDALLSISLVAILSLLPIYHRFYDASLLVIPLTWAICNLRCRPHVAWPLLLIIMSFALPAGTIRRLIGGLNLEPETLSTWWWTLLVEPFRIWLLIAGAAMLVVAAGINRTPTSRRWKPVGALLRLRGRPAVLAFPTG